VLAALELELAAELALEPALELELWVGWLEQAVKPIQISKQISTMEIALTFFIIITPCPVRHFSSIIE